MTSSPLLVGSIIAGNLILWFVVNLVLWERSHRRNIRRLIGDYTSPWKVIRKRLHHKELPDSN